MKPAQLAAAAFERAYGAAPQLYAWAPGRLNLIGEHVDYAGGLVLPVALDRGVTVAAAAGQAGRIRVHSDQFLEAGVAEFDPQAAPPPAFTAFVHALAAETHIVGADLAVVSDLPLERGWSSSAAFAVAVASALVALEDSQPRPTALELCQLCQRAEQQALGVACGLMDQYAAVFGRRDAAVLLDTYYMTHSYVPLNLGEARLVLIDSGQPRRLAQSGYNQRRGELASALNELKQQVGEFASYRDLNPDVVLKHLPELSETSMRRLRHVVTEQERVEHFAAQLPAGHPVELGQLLSASHWSLSEDYAVSTLELDQLCELLCAEAGVYGARLVGGGFGGGVLALAAQDALPGRIERALAAYTARTQLHAEWQEARTGDGAKIQLAAGAAPQAVAEWLK